MATPTTLPATFVAGNVLTAVQMNDLRGAFRILQVVSTTKDDTFTSASTTFTDVTGVSVTITPSSTNSKVLVILSFNACNNVGTAAMHYRLDRAGTAIAVGAAAGSRDQVTGSINNASSFSMDLQTMVYLDSPATTSATTYKLQARNTAAATLFVNRAAGDSDVATSPRGVTTITVCEVSA